MSRSALDETEPDAGPSAPTPTTETALAPPLPPARLTELVTVDASYGLDPLGFSNADVWFSGGLGIATDEGIELDWCLARGAVSAVNQLLRGRGTWPTDAYLDVLAGGRNQLHRWDARRRTWSFVAPIGYHGALSRSILAAHPDGGVVALWISTDSTKSFASRYRPKEQQLPHRLSASGCGELTIEMAAGANESDGDGFVAMLRYADAHMVFVCATGIETWAPGQERGRFLPIRFEDRWPHWLETTGGPTLVGLAATDVTAVARFRNGVWLPEAGPTEGGLVLVEAHDAASATFVVPGHKTVWTLHADGSWTSGDLPFAPEQMVTDRTGQRWGLEHDRTILWGKAPGQAWEAFALPPEVRNVTLRRLGPLALLDNGSTVWAFAEVDVRRVGPARVDLEGNLEECD